MRRGGHSEESWLLRGEVVAVRRGGRTVDRRTLICGDGGSVPSAAALKLSQFRPPHICLCL